MNRSIAVLVIAVMLSCTASAQDPGKPWWNPFARDASQSDMKSSSFFNGSGPAKKPLFQMPKLPSFGSKKSPPRNELPQPPNSLGTSLGTQSSNTVGIPKSSKPSTFKKIGATTNRVWRDTVDFINPFDAKPKPKYQGYQPQKMQAEKKQGFFSWLSSEQPEEINDVNGFLSQPRPKL